MARRKFGRLVEQLDKTQMRVYYGIQDEDIRQLFLGSLPAVSTKVFARKATKMRDRASVLETAIESLIRDRSSMVKLADEVEKGRRDPDLRSALKPTPVNGFAVRFTRGPNRVKKPVGAG